MKRPPPKPPSDERRRTSAGKHHLSEDDLVAEARRDAALPAQTPSHRRHLAGCELCRSRLALTRELLRVDTLGTGRDDAQRAAALTRRLEAARLADRRPALVHVRRPSDGGLALDAVGAEVFARSPSVELRRGSDPAPTPLGCRRRFGDYEIEVAVARSPGASDGLVDLDVRLAGPATRRPSASLASNGRELAVRPLKDERTTFRELPPGTYAVDVSDRRMVVGRLIVTLAGDEELDPSLPSTTEGQS